MKRFYSTCLTLLTLITCQTQAVLPSWLTQTGNVIKKHPVLITSAATVAGISLAGVAGWYLWNQHKKLDPVEREKREREAFFKNDYDKLPDIEKDFTEELSALYETNIEYKGNNGDQEQYARFFHNKRQDKISEYGLVQNHQSIFEDYKYKDPSCNGLNNTLNKDFDPLHTQEWYNNKMRLIYAYHDPKQKKYNETLVIVSNESNRSDALNVLKNKKPSCEEKKQLQQEVIRDMAQIYKIHIQVKPENLIFFVQQLLSFMAHDANGIYINKIKVTSKFSKGLIIPKESKTAFPANRPCPVIVAYLPLIPGNKKEKNLLLAKIINALLAHFRKSKFKNKLSEISLGLTPRYNFKIRDFMYLAQGNSNDKEQFPETLNYYRSNIYTEDMAFFKGYEFDMRLIKQDGQP
jgi:hypothetical protein